MRSLNQYDEAAHHFSIRPSRRSVLAGAAAAGAGIAGASSVSALGQAAYPFNVPAIPVRAPAERFLIALAAAGDRIVAVGVHGIVIYSDDQGRSWRQATVPVDVTLTCVAFASPRVGWAAGHYGVVLKTEDGGATWRMRLNGLQVNQLTLQSAQNLPPNSTAPGAEFAMRRALNFQKGGPNRPFLCILAVSEASATVFGSYRMAVTTGDGGSSWTDSSLSIDDRLSHNLYGICVAGTDVYIASEAGQVFHGIIGGAGYAALESPSPVTLLGVLAPHPQTLLVYGVAGNCYRSPNAGQSWTQIDMGTQDNLTAGHNLASGKVLVASESGGLFASKDGGVTFNALSGLPKMAIFDFLPLPGDGFVFVGGGGVQKVARHTLDL